MNKTAEPICDMCEERLANTDIAQDRDYDLCTQCFREIRGIMRESAKEGERGKGQQTIGKQNAFERRRNE